MKNIKYRARIIILPLLFLCTLSIQAFVPATALACGNASGSSTDQVLHGINQASSGDCSGSGVTTIIADVVSIFSYIIGIAAVIMILVSGFRYILSGGDSAKVAGAKNTLIYAMVGVAIAALAQLFVHFVLYQASKA